MGGAVTADRRERRGRATRARATAAEQRLRGRRKRARASAGGHLAGAIGHREDRHPRQLLRVGRAFPLRRAGPLAGEKCLRSRAAPRNGLRGTHDRGARRARGGDGVDEAAAAGAGGHGRACGDRDLALTIPTVFIVGAPRCGTTSLAAYLASHPQVFMSKAKEPHHFGSDLDVRWRPYADRRRYLQLFERARDGQQAGEASVFYLYSKTAAREIRQLSPSATIIIMLP